MFVDGNILCVTDCDIIGWYDIFLVGNLHAYNGYNTQCDESVRYTSKLLIDPLGDSLIVIINKL